MISKTEKVLKVITAHGPIKGKEIQKLIENSSITGIHGRLWSPD
jgi:hypothetical protein